jgi:hypothetical protein
MFGLATDPDPGRATVASSEKQRSSSPGELLDLAEPNRAQL